MGRVCREVLRGDVCRWCVFDMCHVCTLQRREEEEHVKTVYDKAMEQERREALRKEKEEATRKKRYKHEPKILPRFSVLSPAIPAH